jgi:hypothetical protein
MPPIYPAKIPRNTANGNITIVVKVPIRIPVLILFILLYRTSTPTLSVPKT